MPDVLLFPGHAGHTREHLEHELAVTQTAGIARRIDRVATAEFGLAACFDIRGDLVRLAHDGPEHADMAAFAVSLARYRAIRRHPPRPAVLLGHSFGHLTALTCAGAFSVEDAARLLCYRNKAVAALPPRRTGMACLGLCAARTRRLLADADADSDAAEKSAIACYNSPAQTVVAGPVTALARLRRLALDNQLLYLRLPASFAFHTRLARPAVATMRALAAGIRQRRLGGAVFSATLRRFCTDDDDLVAQMARDLARPVYFRHAVGRLHAAGAAGFVECGPGALLARLVAETLPGATLDPRARTACLTPS